MPPTEPHLPSQERRPTLTTSAPWTRDPGIGPPGVRTRDLTRKQLGLGQKLAPAAGRPSPAPAAAGRRAFRAFTPVTQTVRGLLTGTPPGTGTIVAALTWSAGIALASYLQAGQLYNHRRPADPR